MNPMNKAIEWIVSCWLSNDGWKMRLILILFLVCRVLASVTILKYFICAVSTKTYHTGQLAALNKHASWQQCLTKITTNSSTNIWLLLVSRHWLLTTSYYSSYNRITINVVKRMFTWVLTENMMSQIMVCNAYCFTILWWMSTKE